MKKVATTKYHYIYELSEKELFQGLTTSKYQLFLKENYEDVKPTFDFDIGSADWETDTLEEACRFGRNYKVE